VNIHFGADKSTSWIMLETSHSFYSSNQLR